MKNKILNNRDGVAILATTRGHVAVNESDLSTISGHTWNINKNGYVTAWIKNDSGRKLVYMHRLIMGLNSDNVDHKNGVKTDNTRENLRIATRAQNLWNQRPRATKLGKFKGVYRYEYKNTHRFIAKIGCNGVRKYLGSFTNEIDAILAYNRAAKELFGEFACYNTVSMIDYINM